MLLGIAIGVYFTLNIGMTIYFAFNDWLEEWEPMRWHWWILMPLFGVVIIAGLSIFHHLESFHKWLINANWYYCWLIDTLGYEKNLGIINRASKRKLTFVKAAELQGTWPRRKLAERISERLKEINK